MKSRLLIIIAMFASLLVGFSDSDAFFEEGIVIEIPLQIMEIEKINGTWYYVSEPFMPESSVDSIIFQSVVFSPPYRFDPPRHTFSDAVFFDEVKETIDILHHMPAFTDHVNPQAGFVAKTNGYSFLVSVNLEELPPLKQFNAGIPINEIQCKDGLVQVFKISDNSPACVSLETKTKLMQRSWADSSGDIIKQRTVQIESEPFKGTITYEKIFTEDGPLQVCKIQEDGDKNCGSPVLNEENCVRYTVWLNEFQKEKVHRTEDFPRYPPWGNQIFPLVTYCESVGEFYHVLIEDSTTEIIWSFVPDEQNKDKIIHGFEYMTDKLLTIQEQAQYCESKNAFRTGQNACQYYD